MWAPRSSAWTAAASAAVQLATALLGNPVVLHEHRLVLLVDPFVGVDAEALHGAVARGDAARAHQQHDHVHRLRALGDEVELPVGLLAEGDRVGLLGVDEVGELDRVADEEDAEVVADQIPVAVLGVELDREAARVARRLGGVPAAGDRGEAQGHVGALAPAPGRAWRACTWRWARRPRSRRPRSSRRRSSRARARRARGCARMAGLDRLRQEGSLIDRLRKVH